MIQGSLGSFPGTTCGHFATICLARHAVTQVRGSFPPTAVFQGPKKGPEAQELQCWKSLIQEFIFKPGFCCFLQDLLSALRGGQAGCSAARGSRMGVTVVAVVTPGSHSLDNLRSRHGQVVSQRDERIRAPCRRSIKPGRERLACTLDLKPKTQGCHDEKMPKRAAKPIFTIHVHTSQSSISDTQHGRRSNSVVLRLDSLSELRPKSTPFCWLSPSSSLHQQLLCATVSTTAHSLHWAEALPSSVSRLSQQSPKAPIDTEASKGREGLKGLKGSARCRPLVLQRLLDLLGPLVGLLVGLAYSTSCQ
ncbi:unnamed protein product [Symbiodinium natans]|uniref:Uncharacterized protein n=1 Tax=Symbiodinium natans TaxID=878477 RepID=A0A812IGA6_9DINO|nr:unnamed protein product [Symbiodinium natans]